MQQGILERIESKLDQLLAIHGKTPVVVETPAETPAPAPAEADSDLDADGVAWDERIHASTKTKTAKGVWKKRKGVSPEVLAEVEAELASDDEPAPSVPAAPAAPAAPSVPAVPSVPAAPSVPSVPAAPAPQGEIDTPKTKAVACITTLTKEWGLPYDSIVELFEEFGASEFTAVPEDKLTELWTRLKAWIDWLKLSKDAIDDIVRMGGDQGQDGVNIILAPATKLSQIHNKDLKSVYDRLTEYQGQWKAAVGA